MLDLWTGRNGAHYLKLEVEGPTKPGMQLTRSGGCILDQLDLAYTADHGSAGACVGGRRNCKARDAINTFRGMHFTSTYTADHGLAGACVHCAPGMVAISAI
jgi:hypothetical protein